MSVRGAQIQALGMAGRAPPFLDGSHPAGQLLPKGVEVVLPPRSARRARQGHFRPPAHAPARCLVRAGTGSGGMGQQPCLSAQRTEGHNYFSLRFPITRRVGSKGVHALGLTALFARRTDGLVCTNKEVTPN